MMREALESLSKEELAAAAGTVCALLVGAVLLLVLRRRSGPGGDGSATNVSVALAGQRATKSDGASAAPPKKVVSKALRWRKATVRAVRDASHDSKFIDLELADEEADGLVLAPGRHVSMRAEVDGEMVVRPYSPISPPDDTRRLTLLVKVYSLGKLSAHLGGLAPGDTVELRGPTGNFKYAPNTRRHLTLCAAGSGLTPCLQLLKYILADPDDTTTVTFHFQNREQRDILMHDELKELSRVHLDRFKLCLWLSKPPAADGSASRAELGGVRIRPADWSADSGHYRRGYVSRAALAELTPEPVDGDMVRRPLVA